MLEMDIDVLNEDLDDTEHVTYTEPPELKFANAVAWSHSAVATAYIRHARAIKSPKVVRYDEVNCLIVRANWYTLWKPSL